MGLSNDERGWVMTCLSGVACALGAAVICVDLVIRLIPSKRHFRIENSDTFMSVSLSLSFGVMLFSALYSMLPSAKQSLVDGGSSPKAAAWILIACFIGGVVGIQILSRLLHRFMPSHAVDCEHNHQDDSSKANGDPHEDSPSKSRNRSTGRSHHDHSHHAPASHQHSHGGHVPQMSETTNTTSSTSQPSPVDSLARDQSADRRSIPRRLTRKLSKLAAGKAEVCTTDGECYGYTDPCGDECFKSVIDRGGFKGPVRNGILKPSLKKSETVSTVPTTATESTPLLASAVVDGDDDSSDARPQTERLHEARTRYYTVREDFSEPLSSRSRGKDDSNEPFTSGHSDVEEAVDDHGDDEYDNDGYRVLKPHPTANNHDHSSPNSPDNQTNNSHHHHHVPTNAFLSIGLQTSIAIALHKLPEGFITYATNHANPQLGVAVFLALFIHNITEGFAMALPLYLAIRSRTKAMIISFALGGLSQPLGAAVAAVWFSVAGNSNWAPDESVYGGMFAVTAGIMASVGLQLFGESLELTHSKYLCFVGAFVGMTVLGISSALTSK